MSVPDEVRARAVDLADEADERGLSNGQRPSGVAAACILIAANHKRVRVTQTELADVADASAITIRKQRDRLYAELAVEV